MQGMGGKWRRRKIGQGVEEERVERGRASGVTSTGNQATPLRLLASN